MNISLNNTEGNITILSKVPNIIELTNSGTGSYTQLIITVDSTTFNNQKIRIGDVTITATEGSATYYYYHFGSTVVETAQSIANTLNNTNLTVDWNIYFKNASVYIIKKIADNLVLDYEADFTTEYQQGTNSDTLVNTEIQLDLYKNDKYAYTCYKTYYKDIAFNISDIISSLTDYESIDDYSAILFNNKGEELGNISFKAVKGYKVASDYLSGSGFATILYSKLFTYYDYVPFYYYADSDITLNVNYYVDNQLTNTESYSYDAGLINTTIYFNYDYDYVDLVVGNDKLTYYKLNTSYTSKVMRVYWMNCYGGISFFDFTSDYQEATEMNYDTYDKSLYSFYKGEREQTAYYNKEVKYTITIKSHILSEIGIFDDLLGSEKIWVERDNERKYIIIKNQSVDKNDYNTYQASITFNYSVNG